MARRSQKAADPPQAQSNPEEIWREYERGMAFKRQLNLFETVRNNENFYIGKQWEGVQANGLPTPVFNFIRRIVLFLVASTATDNLKINASPLAAGGAQSTGNLEAVCAAVNAQLEALAEENKLGKLTRSFMRNAAVDGDGCLYTWFDPEAETGQKNQGAIRTELLENTRVIFGDPNCAEVQEQPYLLLVRRTSAAETARRAVRYGGSGEIYPDGGESGSVWMEEDGKCTTLLRLWREEGTIRACECTRTAVVRPPWDTGQRRYPIVWMPWDYIQDCYHGAAAVTGLIPNQIFVNKMFAMTMISLMTTAYPKVVYDKTRIARWDAQVGAAIGVNGGDVGTVAKTMDPAAVSPQISQFMELAISYTKEFSGATDAALGTVKPDNTSAIIALQKASGVPLELVKQNFFQCIEDLGQIWMDLMRVYYGRRYVRTGKRGDAVPFDFSSLGETSLTLKLDVGGSSYWSEIAQMNTLDNLLSQGKISVVDYLERVPNGYISNQQQLIDTLRAQADAQMTTSKE
ncbi:MAG: hypothetical protein HFE97_07505 [Oscillospiraceae bacterium]|nr:hypothetical protein [Oscillospiraceae bacterium]